MIIMNFSLVVIIFGLAKATVGLKKEQAFLDSESKYLLTWQVNFDTKVIEFEAVVETTGFIGFGISAVGKMNNSDLFIAGVSNNGWLYSYDMHGVDQSPVVDEKHDWNLISAQQNNTHTMISFWRLLDTCDDQDFSITNDTTRVIWSYGTTDTISYHGSNRGTKSFNFLAPEEEAWDSSKYQRFDITATTTMPGADTTYWCTIHRGPRVTGKNHIVSFEALLDNPEAFQYTHHFILTICHAPPGVNATEFFEPFVAHEGHDCYVLENQPLPLQYCKEYVYVWAVGGRPARFPENLGYPFGESDSEVYYALEVHYNNPHLIENLTFKTGLTIYYTDELREIDVGQIRVHHETDPSLIVPPMSSDFVMSTHCASTCTDLFPQDGIKVFNVLLHSHLAGRKMTFRHFRSRKELPWIIKDNNYDFNFQQNAPLEPVTILPGDHLTVECVFDSTDRDGKIISGGLPSREEMCEAVFWYYPRIPAFKCGSQYPYEKAVVEYGATNYTMQPMNTWGVIPWIWAPEELAGPNGSDYITMLNTKFNWTKEYIEQMRLSRQFGEHEYHCLNAGETIYGFTQYPEIDEPYSPPQTCVTLDNQH